MESRDHEPLKPAVPSDKVDVNNCIKFSQHFCARAFVNDLIEKGSVIPCDDRNDAFKSSLCHLPVYYDREMFERGQQFFHKHIWAMLFAKIMGLVTLLSVPDLADVLKFTQMSDDPQVAYKRYLATVFHMYVWYNDDFRPESRLWNSFEKVKFKHNRTSQLGCKANGTYISQKNMALTQFGFMGFAICRTKLVGIYGADEKDLEDFIHVWRVIGHVMGIEARFNICRHSVQETKAICEELIRRVFRPEMEQKHHNFLHLSHALLSGMWCMMPLLEHKSFIHVIASALPSSFDGEKIVDFNLNPFQKVYARMILGYMTLFRFNLLRICNRYVIYISLWLMENFPFLAYYRFGKANSHVKVC